MQSHPPHWADLTNTVQASSGVSKPRMEATPKVPHKRITARVSCLVLWFTPSIGSDSKVRVILFCVFLAVAATCSLSFSSLVPRPEEEEEKRLGLGLTLSRPLLRVNFSAIALYIMSSFSGRHLQLG